MPSGAVLRLNGACRAVSVSEVEASEIGANVPKAYTKQTAFPTGLSSSFLWREAYRRRVRSSGTAPPARGAVEHGRPSLQAGMCEGWREQVVWRSSTRSSAECALPADMPQSGLPPPGRSAPVAVAAFHRPVSPASACPATQTRTGAGFVRATMPRAWLRSEPGGDGWPVGCRFAPVLPAPRTVWPVGANDRKLE